MAVEAEIALRRGETDVNTSDPKVIAQARDDLIKGVNTMDWKLDVHDYTDMPEGESYIHQGWSGDFVSVQYFYPGWSPRDVISYWYPDNGKGSVGGDHFAVLASGRNPVLAHQFLNYMLDFKDESGSRLCSAAVFTKRAGARADLVSGRFRRTRHQCVCPLP